MLAAANAMIEATVSATAWLNIVPPGICILHATSLGPYEIVLENYVLTGPTLHCGRNEGLDSGLYSRV